MTDIAISKWVDHPSKRIPVRYRREYACKGRKRIEYASEICERGKEECRDDIYLIEILRIESIDKSKKWEEESNQEEDENRESRMFEHAWEEEEWDHIDDDGDESATYDSTERISCDDSSRMYRCDEEFFDRLLEFCSEKRRWHIRVRIRDHRHEDDPWNEECYIVPSPDLSDTRSDESSEYDEVERLCDDWWEDRLWPDTYDAYEFFADDSIKSRKLKRHKKNLR